MNLSRLKIWRYFIAILAIKFVKSFWTKTILWRWVV